MDIDQKKIDGLKTASFRSMNLAKKRSLRAWRQGQVERTTDLKPSGSEAAFVLWVPLQAKTVLRFSDAADQIGKTMTDYRW